MDSSFWVVVVIGVMFLIPTKNRKSLRLRLISVLILLVIYLNFYLVVKFTSLSENTVSGTLACVLGLLLYPINLIERKRGTSKTPNYVAAIGALLFLSGGIYLLIT